MYLIPQPYKCSLCNHEFMFSPHEHHSAPVFDQAPACPKCWERFVRENVGIGRYVLPPKKSGEA